MKPSSHSSKLAIWRFFSSLKLTIALLILLAILAVFGTFIPLEIFDMYHSPGFRFLIGCLAVNLIICSLDQFPTTWKHFTTIPAPDREKPFEAVPGDQVLFVTEDIQTAVAAISRFIQSRYTKIYTKAEQNKYFFHMQKGRISHFGVYLVHISVLLVLLGALVGSFFGFKGYMTILEGHQANRIMLDRKHAIKPLGFSVRCDNFTRKFYENGTIKEYRSDLTFLMDGDPVKKKILIVNHPVTFRDINFYQSSFGYELGNKARLTLTRPTDHETDTVETEFDVPFELPREQGTLTVVNAKADFMELGPAVLVSVVPTTGEGKQFWVFQDYEKALNLLPGPMLLSQKFDPTAFKPYTMTLDWVEVIPYTGIQVTKDPGVPLVWTGFFMMIAGFLGTFFMSHKRIWVRVSEKNNKVKISTAGTTNKNPMDLQREIDKLVAHLKTVLENAR